MNQIIRPADLNSEERKEKEKKGKTQFGQVLIDPKLITKIRQCILRVEAAI